MTGKRTAYSLAEMLGKGVELLDKDIERVISSLLVKLEPLLTLTMGLVVALILYGRVSTDVRLYGAFEIRHNGEIVL